MVKSLITYQGGLRNVAKHQPSGTEILTDAPVDNHGKGEAFSPTDLLGAALGACMNTLMGIYAERKGVDLTGMRIEVGKEMSADVPRRISKLSVEIWMPIGESSEHAEALKCAALTCPVHHSLHPEIEKPVIWHWTE
jgi:uncharacterized OsmC-like protein